MHFFHSHSPTYFISPTLQMSNVALTAKENNLICFWFIFVGFLLFFVHSAHRQLDNFYQKEVRSNDNIMSSPKNLQDCYFYYYSVCRKVSHPKFVLTRLDVRVCVYFCACCCLAWHAHKHALHPICTNLIFLCYFNGETKQKKIFFINFFLFWEWKKIFLFCLGIILFI